MKANSKSNRKNKFPTKTPKTSGKLREQPRKDSGDKRVNFDNTRESRFDKDLRHDDKDNDISWYSNNAELLKSAASLPFSVTTGEQIPLMNGGNNLNHVPGVMVLDYLPSFGGANSEAIKLAGDSIYSFVIHANSRNTSYNAVDQMLIIAAATEVFAAIANGVRAYGIAKTFDQRSRYLPDSLIQAMGFDPQDIRSNLSNMWFDLNDIIVASSNIWIPDTLPIVKRRYWLNSNVYMDSESVKGQFYVFNQEGYMAYDETQTSTGGGLSWITPQGTLVPFSSASDSAKLSMEPSKKVTWSQYVTAIRGMINLLLNSEDRGIIMGDFLKAYGADHIFALKPIPVDYTLVPVYDREVLTQIENANVCDTSYFAISQVDGRLSPYTKGYNLANGASDPLKQTPQQSILNFHQKEVPTPEQIMVATRLKTSGFVGYRNGSNPGVLIAPAETGTEFVTQIFVLTFRDNSFAPYVYKYPVAIPQTDAVSQEAVLDAMAFDWAPWMYSLQTTVVPATGNLTTPSVIYGCFGDFENYTMISRESLAKMHKTAIYSEYNVPTIGL